MYLGTLQNAISSYIQLLLLELPHKFLTQKFPGKGKKSKKDTAFLANFCHILLINPHLEWQQETNLCATPAAVPGAELQRDRHRAQPRLCCTWCFTPCNHLSR